MLILNNPIDFCTQICLLFLKRNFKGTVGEGNYLWVNILQLPIKSKKLSVVKHKRYLVTNNILRWKTVFNKLGFFEGMMFCSIFPHSNMTLTKFNSVAFLVIPYSNSVKGLDSTRLSGYYFSYEVTCLFKKDRLRFLKGYYKVKSDKELLKYLLSKMSGFSDTLPYNWKRPPWRSRKKGGMQRLDFFYSDKVLVFNLIKDIVLENRYLFLPLLDLIKNYIPLLYSDIDVRDSRTRRLRLEVKEEGNLFFWNSEHREELLLLIFANLPLCYWSIYSHLIKDVSVRKSLVTSSICHLVSSSNRGLMKKEGDRNHYYKLTTKNLDSVVGGFCKRGDYY